jgi:hypothetical protein
MHVDGFRLDAAPYLYEDGNRLYSCPATFQFWQDFHTYYKSINDSAVTVGEVWYPTNTILPYVTGGDKLDFCFEFDLATQIINVFNSSYPVNLKNEMQYDYDQFPYLQFATFLTNHDQDRVIDKFSGSISKMKAAVSTYLTLPGIPFVYYGEEIGMTGSGADENKRRPMQWTNGAHAGFSTGNPWEAINNNYTTYNVASEEADSNSLLNWYKKLIAIRHEEPALPEGFAHFPYVNPDAPKRVGVHGALAYVLDDAGSGQLLGKGISGATQSRLAFLPERHTDFIFAVFAETWGFVGCLVLILAYGVLIVRGFEIAVGTREARGRIIALGVTALFAAQTLINLGMVTGLLPVVGIPLPLMSYGGSSMVVSFMALGLLLSVRMRQFQ